MKKLILTLNIAIAAHFSYAQNTFPGTGNVGIGTTNPGSNLDIQATNPTSLSSSTNQSTLTGTVYGTMAFRSFLGVGSQFYGNNDALIQTVRENLSWSGNAFTHDAGLAFYTNSSNRDGVPTEKFRITSYGNVGIGTASPGSNLDIQATNPTSLSSSTNQSTSTGTVYGTIAFRSFLGVGSQFYGNNDALIQTVRDNASWSGNAFTHDAGLAFYTNSSNRDGAPTEKFRITSYGNVGIGTTSPDEKLTVKGKIHSQEVIVDAMTTVPDYVFEPDYKLTSLTELKRYVDQNHHLPNIPSANEIEKNGIQLGDMSMKLLKTIEELTLHIIELNNQVKLQNEKIISLENQIKK
jgi:hypothetical protein